MTTRYASTLDFFGRLLAFGRSEETAPPAKKTSLPVPQPEKMRQPTFSPAKEKPIKLTTVKQSDGRMSQYPPPEHWDDWVEWDAQAWPRRVARRYTLVPTICFNCESACGLLAYVDKETYEIRRFEGNSSHLGSRGRNCAKGPATINQITDPDRILYPMKRAGKRGEGKWERVSWDEVLDAVSARMRKDRKSTRLNSSHT